MMAGMSFITLKAEVGQDDQIQVRSEDPDGKKHVFDATVRWVNVESVGVLTLTCEITGEVPAWVIEQAEQVEQAARERAERKACRRRWHRGTP